jgi:hypothetical protein
MGELDFSERVSSRVTIAYPDFNKLPRGVKKFDDLRAIRNVRNGWKADIS